MERGSVVAKLGRSVERSRAKLELNSAKHLAALEINDYYFLALFITEWTIRAHDETVAIDTSLDYGTTDR